MILKLLKRLQALEREAAANRLTGGPGIRLHRRPYGTSIEADRKVKAGPAAATAAGGRARWG